MLDSGHGLYKGTSFRGANVSFVDKLDELPSQAGEETTLHQSAPGTHQPISDGEREIAQVADLIGGGGWTRTMTAY